MTKRLIIVLIGLAVVFGGIFGFKWFVNQQMTAFFDNMPTPPVAVSTAKADTSAWRMTIPAVGSLRAVNGVQVASEVPGKIENIAFESGQTVARGDLLVQLDTSTDRAELDALQAQLALAQADLKRQRELRRRQTNSQADFDAAVAQARQLEAQIASQQARIDKKSIRAPFAGTVGIRQVDLGEFVSAGTPVVSLQQLSPMLVDFTLPEQHLDAIAVGQPLEIRVDSAPDTVIAGHVTAIDPQVAEATRNFAVQGRVDNADRRLRPGQFARIQVVEPDGARSLVTLPSTAITYNPYGDSVYVVTDGEAGEGGQRAKIASRKFVEIGPRRGDQVAVLSGIEAGTEVVTAGQLKLRNGSVLNINNETQPANSANPSPANQ